MKFFNYLIALAISVLMFSCVSTKKYTSLNSDYQKSLSNQKECIALTEKMKKDDEALNNQNKLLADQV